MISRESHGIQKWEAVRRKGKKRFILLFGVLAWGLPMFVVWLFLNRQGAVHMPLLKLFGYAIIWAAGGGGFGWAMWVMKEKRYQQLCASRKAG